MKKLLICLIIGYDLFKKIERTQTILKKEIFSLYRKNDYNRIVRLCDTYADVSQRVNNIIYDEEIETLLEKISQEQINSTDDILNNVSDSMSEKRIVFYDQIGSLYCLGLQYLRALTDSGYKVLYIFESSIQRLDAKLKQELENAEVDIRVYYSETKGQIELAKIIREDINQWGANKIIIQSPAFSALSTIIFHSLKNIERIRIVPGDHHFYVGVKCTDKFIEFRDYGVLAASQRRMIPLEKIYKLPYYPVVDDFVSFQGFPSEAAGKINIMTAGNPYKFLGSDIYYQLCKGILDKYENVVILHVGEKSKELEDFILKNNFQYRLLLLGFRKDFNACIKHADIFMASFPFAGGLVSQFAAYYNKPILAFTDIESTDFRRSINAMLGDSNNSEILKNGKEDFYNYADQLINDESFRTEEGRKIHQLLTTESKFKDSLNMILCGETIPETEQKIERYNFRKDYYVNLYLYSINHHIPSVLNILLKTYKCNVFFKYPFFIIDYTKNALYYLNYLKQIKKRVL